MNYKYLVFIFLYNILFPVLCFAFAVTVEPVRQEFKGSPGEKLSGSYFVTNQTDENINVVVSYRDWFKLKENEDISIDSWLRITQKEFSLKQKEIKEINFEITIPDAVGFVMTMISFAPAPETGRMLTTIFSVSLYVIIEGTEIIEAEIDEVVVRKEKENFIRTAVSIKNNGNVYFRPRGQIIIKKGRKEIVRLTLRHGKPVYPGRIDALFGDWEGKEAVLKKGKYTAKAIVIYDTEDNTLEKKIRFRVDRAGDIIIKDKKTR